MKFKVGDKVRVIGHNGEIIHFYEVGWIGTVRKCDEERNAYVVIIRGKSYKQKVNEIDLELIKDDSQVKHHAPKVYDVYEELKKNAVGRENAIQASDLCFICYLSSHRELREIIREIRRSGELEKIPCSCNDGYYMASTKEEAQKAIDRLVNTAKNELKTAYTMAKKLGLDGQMKIQFGKYWSDTYHSLMGEDDETDTETD